MWRVCMKGEGRSTRTLVFPDVDRVLALALPDADAVTLAVTTVNCMFSTHKLGETSRSLIDFEVRSRDTWSRLTPLRVAAHKMDALLTVVCRGIRDTVEWNGIPRCPDQLLDLYQAAGR